MANTIIQQVSAELESLQNELIQFKSTVDYLNDVKIQMNDAKQTVNAAEKLFIARSNELKQAYSDITLFKVKIDNLIEKIEAVNFPERLDKIESGFIDLLEIEDGLSTQLKESISSLDSQINKIDFNKKHDELRKDVSRLEKNNEQLINDIKAIDIPKRIETFKYSINTKLENTTAELEKNTRKISEDATKSIIDLNIPIRLDKADANIAGLMSAVLAVQSRIDSHERVISDKFSDFTNKLNLSISNVYKRQNILTYSTWAILALGFIIVTIILQK